jgi:hypothetical protein
MASQARLARARVLKNLAAHSHISIRTLFMTNFKYKCLGSNSDQFQLEMKHQELS